MCHFVCGTLSRAKSSFDWSVRGLLSDTLGVAGTCCFGSSPTLVRRSDTRFAREPIRATIHQAYIMQ